MLWAKTRCLWGKPRRPDTWALAGLVAVSLSTAVTQNTRVRMAAHRRAASVCERPVLSPHPLKAPLSRGEHQNSSSVRCELTWRLPGDCACLALPAAKRRRPAGCWPQGSAAGRPEGVLQPLTKQKRQNSKFKTTCAQKGFSLFLSFSVPNTKRTKTKSTVARQHKKASLGTCAPRSLRPAGPHTCQERRQQTGSCGDPRESLRDVRVPTAPARSSPCTHQQRRQTSSVPR